MSKLELEKITTQFSKNWLNRKGIWGIEPKSDHKNQNIVMYVNLDEIDYDEIPKQYKGVRTIIKPVDKFEAQTS
ncbi:MAG: hypothetical protein EHM58_09975 [Ignavibacteriae bacterium]|nr:MAG: hypothetical protein EHM58_09975 [Ignavibacteriota bacterium]